MIYMYINLCLYRDIFKNNIYIYIYIYIYVYNIYMPPTRQVGTPLLLPLVPQPLYVVLWYIIELLRNLLISLENIICSKKVNYFLRE